MRKLLITAFLTLFALQAFATKILVPMDETQTNHMKAYGIAYWVLAKDEPIQWMLNYKGGSFLLPGRTGVENELIKEIIYEGP